jgi:glycosyltransferase involved in cell wall biosynthesis
MHANSRADLHLHSKFSDRAADWLSRRLDFPASCTEPTDIYHILREEKGFPFVTITDHQTIDGCLEIADRPGVFLSEEITVLFPEDGAKVHLLVYGLNEEQHRELQQLRGNIYEMQAWLAGQELLHGVAHPLQSPDEKLTSKHWQKLILLFRHFEVINGKYPALPSQTAEFCLRGLTPAVIERLVGETGLEPTHAEPWAKVFLGGSDDVGGMFLGCAWTETPPVHSPGEFLLAIREGRCEPAGQNGHPLRLAHSTYKTAYTFAQKKLSGKSHGPGLQLVEKVFERFMEGRDPTVFTFAEKMGFLAQGIATGKIFEMAKAGQSSLWKELSGYFSGREMKAELARVTAGVEEPERRAFYMADLIAGQLSFRLVSQFVHQIAAGKVLESVQMVAPLLPIVALLAPYLHAFRQTPRTRLIELASGVTEEVPPMLRNEKRAWFTDTLDDVNGVSTTIQKMTAAGQAVGYDVVVVTSRSEVKVQGIPLKNFPPIGEFNLPEYELQSLSFPPVLQILDYIAREDFTELIISTPGPVGLTAVLAAELLGLPSVSIYHTDFPQYVGILTDDSFMETLTWNYMHWFYSQQELVYVNSEDYRRSWIKRGIAEDKLRILPRGLDTKLFHPAKRSATFWRERGLADGEIGALFVGRISREKNLELLVAASRELEKRQAPLRFLFVGDGPFLKELRQLLPQAIFTGTLSGEDLAAAYASADLFVFPSTTDTFGNVVIEAQACGLPCIVSDLGGPRDLVTQDADGIITRAFDVGELTEALVRLADSAELRAEMGRAGRRKVETRDWGKAFATFWQHGG